MDWFTPPGLGAWGDGRVFIMGTEGTIEIRKYIDVGVSQDGDIVMLVDSKGEHRVQVTGKVGFVFFGQIIKDCLRREEKAISQNHIFDSMKVTIEAQNVAQRIE